MLSLKSDLLNLPVKGELIYIDFPTENHAMIQRSLTRLSSEVPECPQEWRLGVGVVGLDRRPPEQ